MSEKVSNFVDKHLWSMLVAVVLFVFGYGALKAQVTAQGERLDKQDTQFEQVVKDIDIMKQEQARQGAKLDFLYQAEKERHGLARGNQ